MTDANLVLGRIDPTYFLGGAMELDRSAAEAAIRQIADRFRWSLETTAEAIGRIATTNIVQAVREVSIDRGYDPRDFTLVAYGGAGPLYASEAAAELGIPEVVVPARAGVFSALGCLCADRTHERLRTILVPADATATETIRAEWRRLEQEAEAWLGGTASSVERYLDARYVGEAWEVTVLIDGDPGDPELVRLGVERFHAEHERLYGFRREDPVEIVNVRVRSTIPVERPRWAAPVERRPGDRPEASVPSGADNRPYRFFFRDELEEGKPVPGPVVVRDPEATTVVHAGQTVTADTLGNLRIDVRPGEERRPR